MALFKWLAELGFDDVFLDVSPERGLVVGQRWQEALKAAADRCEAVLFLVSPAWLASKWCLAEFLLAKTLHKRIFGLLVEPVPLDRIPAEMTSEWQMCQLAGDDLLRTFDVSIGMKHETVTFRQAGLDLLRHGLERAGLDAKSFPWPPPDDSKRAPYRGLRALEPQDAAIFFGRDAAIVRGLDRVRGLAEDGIETLLVILGGSGSGKSSFLRAGLWPRLMRDDVAFLALPVIRPQTAVITGSSGLVCALATAFDRLGSARAPGRIKELLDSEVDGVAGLLNELSALAKHRLVGLGGEQQEPAIVLAVDQAEELFNKEGASEAETFLQMLAKILAPADKSPARRVLAVMTIRSDRYEVLQADLHLSAVKQDLFNLPPILGAEFKTIIEGPARRVVEAGGRLAIEPALTEQLVADAQGADALPLLAFTLERLYADYGSEGALTLSHYEKLGGVKGSIEAAIVRALSEPNRSPQISVSKEEQLAGLRAAFIPWLARINPDNGEPLRREAQLDDIPEASRALVNRLVEARLLVADRRSGADVIEIAHESLLRQWPALTSWLNADADDLKTIDFIERAASEWSRNGQHAGWLDHRAERLSAAERVATRPDFRRRLGEEGIAYIEACRAREIAEREAKEAQLAEVAAAQARTARLQRRARWTLAAMAAAVFVGIGFGFLQYRINLTRQQQLDRAQVNLLAELATTERLQGNPDGALRFAVQSRNLDSRLGQRAALAGPAQAALASAVAQSDWRLSLAGHEDHVLSAEFSPDGTRIVTASDDNTARIWDAATGKEIAVLRGHDGGVHSAAYSPDGTQIVTASEDHTARIWNVATAKTVAILYGHTNEVWSAAFSADGSRIVTASFDKTAMIWDAVKGKAIATLRGHDDSVWSAAYRPNGAQIVTASSDNTLRIWDAATGDQISILTVPEKAVSAAFSPDGTQIVAALRDKTARILDSATGNEITVLRGHEDFVWSAVFSPEGSRILTASWDNTARLWDAATGKQTATLTGHENYVISAAFSRDGKQIVTASFDRTARVWDTTQQISILNGHRDQVRYAAYNSDGSRLVTASWDNTARIWDVKTGIEIAVLRGHEDGVSSAVFAPDDSKIVTASWDKTARIWSATTGEQIAILRGHEHAVRSAVFSPDGSQIITASWDKTARIWDSGDGKQIMVLRPEAGSVWWAEYSGDGSRIVTAQNDGTARIWDAASRKQIAVLRGHGLIVLYATFSPDSSKIATASADNTARIWDVRSGEQLAVLRGHRHQVSSAIFNPNGLRIATASLDETARIWDTASGQEIAVLRGPEAGLSSAVFNPLGSRIVTAGWDKTVRIWDVRFATMSTNELLSETCTRRLVGLTQPTPDEMRLAGHADGAPTIDVCEGASGNTVWQRNRALASMKLADALKSQGDLPGALQSYQASLAITEQLAKADPGNTEVQLSLALAHSGIGDVLRAQKHLPEALQAYSASIAIEEKLAKADPDNTVWLSEVSILNDKIGDVLLAQGELTDALKSYGNSLAARHRLNKTDPVSPRWQRDLSISYDEIAAVQVQQGNLTSALESYRESLAIRQRLASVDRTNAQSKDDLEFVVGKIGGLSYRLLLARDFENALAAADAAIAVAPDEIWLYTNRAHALMFLGRNDEARELYLRYRGVKNVEADKNWDAVVLEDFADLRKAGLSHTLMEEIEHKFETAG